MTDAYDKQRDDSLDFPDDCRAEPTTDEVKEAVYREGFACNVDESGGLRDG